MLQALQSLGAQAVVGSQLPARLPLQGNRYPALLGEQQQRARRAVPVQLALDPQPLQARAMAPGRIDQVEVADSSIEQGAVHLAVAGKAKACRARSGADSAPSTRRRMPPPSSTLMIRW